MIVGFIVNRFRGDPALFADGMKEIERRTGWPALGLLPFFEHAHRLPAEDALGLSTVRRGEGVKVVVLAYPRIANFDDFDPLRLEQGVDLVFLRPGEAIPGDAALVILPGSKATIADLSALRAAGWDIDLQAHVRRGGQVLGICGGYQMLGRTVADPHGIEGLPSTVDGLGLLDVDTVLEGDKVLVEVTGTAQGVPFKGYEMHIGRTTGNEGSSPAALLGLDGHDRGAVSSNGRIAGCYIHGLLADDRQRRHWLDRLGAATSGLDYEADVDATLDRLADHIEKHVDCDRLLALARPPLLTRRP
jgi:adenosylcobyric acid synthase